MCLRTDYLNYSIGLPSFSYIFLSFAPVCVARSRSCFRLFSWSPHMADRGTDDYFEYTDPELKSVRGKSVRGTPSHMLDYTFGRGRRTPTQGGLSPGTTIPFGHGMLPTGLRPTETIPGLGRISPAVPAFLATMEQECDCLRPREGTPQIREIQIRTIHPSFQ